jgi:hypothetical protein
MLIQLLNGDAVVYIYNTESKEIDIRSEVLRRQFEKGIKIPPSNRDDFNGKKIVILADSDFHKAVDEIFFKTLDQTVFRWSVTSGYL